MASDFPVEDYGLVTSLQTESEDWGAIASATDVPAEDYGLTSGIILPDANSIVTGPVLISTTALAQDYTFSTAGILTGSVVISTTTIDQVHNLTSNNIATLPPIVPSIALIEAETVAAVSILTGTPLVQSSTIGQVHTLNPSSIQTPRPVVGTASDPNHIIIIEIEEAQRMFGGWQRRTYEVPDGRLVQGEREVYSTYCQRVSIDAKAKSLLKFGKSGNLSTTAGLQTVWSVDGNETYQH